ncbi:flagellar protein FlaG [Clostridium tagluense]|uniref:flagellar protein FlaG n=1 Tax=Clostridium tagluense TaxID=360422 RepID=UPI001C6F0686|nr:flagellar protein FlaG [Clostridium tagluense]MBW9154971.1 flagellar protein FlaG [Clostridium tagluense]WLC64423.1 flagellar protein FlaG [Clostridium tagluense]
MEMGGIGVNKSMGFDKSYKVPENVEGSKPAEGNSSLSESDNSEIEVKNAVNKINKFLAGEGTHVQYEKHDVLNQMIIKVIDNNTNEVIKEIPSRKILDMVAKMCEMAGILVDKKA